MNPTESIRAGNPPHSPYQLHDQQGRTLSGVMLGLAQVAGTTVIVLAMIGIWFWSNFGFLFQQKEESKTVIVQAPATQPAAVNHRPDLLELALAGKLTAKDIEAAKAVTDKPLTVEQKVEKVRDGLMPNMSFGESSWMPKPDRADKNLTTMAVHQEFGVKPLGSVYCERFYPFESPTGPAYRVNLLWECPWPPHGQPFDQNWLLANSRLAAYYFRSPN
jgi:hypothetical protein